MYFGWAVFSDVRYRSSVTEGEGGKEISLALTHSYFIPPKPKLHLNMRPNRGMRVIQRHFPLPARNSYPRLWSDFIGLERGSNVYSIA